jgi:c-di-GMP-binding flagellar brake protein YcgR
MLAEGRKMRAMDMEEEVEPLAEPAPDRRSYPRFVVDELASLIELKHEATIPCHVVDLSLTGCRLRALKPFLPGLHSRVEVGFKVRGLSLRFNGEAQWTDDCRTVGIQFVDVTSRRREELAEILDEVAADDAAKAEKRAAEEQAAKEKAAAGELRKSELAEKVSQNAGVKAPEGKSERGDSRLAAAGKVLRQQAFAKSAAGERRKQVRQEVDTSAEIHLINVGTRLTGRILDLSPGGCHIRTDERFPVGIYVRVETVFHLHGLPFRLGGVIQAIHDRHNVGIRFLDMSPRKREYVDQMIEEIEEMRTWQRQAEPSRMDKDASAG